MRYSYILANSGLLAMVAGHGLVTSIQGANGVTMPGLSGKEALPQLITSTDSYVLTRLLKSPTALHVTAAAMAAALKQTLASSATKS